MAGFKAPWPSGARIPRCPWAGPPTPGGRSRADRRRESGVFTASPGRFGDSRTARPTGSPRRCGKSRRPGLDSGPLGAGSAETCIGTVIPVGFRPRGRRSDRGRFTGSGFRPRGRGSAPRFGPPAGVRCFRPRARGFGARGRPAWAGRSLPAPCARVRPRRPASDRPRRTFRPVGAGSTGRAVAPAGPGGLRGLASGFPFGGLAPGSAGRLEFAAFRIAPRRGQGGGSNRCWRVPPHLPGLASPEGRRSRPSRRCDGSTRRSSPVRGPRVRTGPVAPASPTLSAIPRPSVRKTPPRNPAAAPAASPAGVPPRST